MTRIQNIFAFTVAAGLAALAPAAANASPLGPYFAAGIGFDQMPDRDLNINGNTVSSQWKAGWGLLGAVGYRWYFGLRTEGEFSGRVSWQRTFNNVNPWAGTQWDDSLMFNALYDFDFGSRITPFLGAGLGLTQIQWGNNFRAVRNPANIYDAESIRMGWQLIAGFSFDVTEKLALAFDYRFKGANGGFGFPSNTAGRFINNFHYETNSVFVSARYAFNL
jgi:opacity protein-like surface antigen